MSLLLLLSLLHQRNRRRFVLSIDSINCRSTASSTRCDTYHVGIKHCIKLHTCVSAHAKLSLGTSLASQPSLSFHLPMWSIYFKITPRILRVDLKIVGIGRRVSFFCSALNFVFWDPTHHTQHNKLLVAACGIATRWNTEHQSHSASCTADHRHQHSSTNQATYQLTGTSHLHSQCGKCSHDGSKPGVRSVTRELGL